MKTYQLPEGVVVVKIEEDDPLNEVYMSKGMFSMSKTAFYALVQNWIEEDILPEKVVRRECVLPDTNQFHFGWHI